MAFQAYALRDVEQKERSRVIFQSLAHFFEAEKFRSSPNRSLFESIVHCPSIKEARKLTRRFKNLWREDWTGVRGRALVSGMQYACWADSDQGRWLAEPQTLASELVGLDLPEKFCTAAVMEHARLHAGPTWVFFGADSAPPDVIGRRINAIHRKQLRAWTLCHWMGRHSNWRIHDWAIDQFIPIRYVGNKKQSLSVADIDALLGSATNVCVFEQRGGKDQDAIIRQVRGAKVPLEIEFYSDPALVTGGLDQRPA
jgi:hypothetical protein